MNIVLLGAPGTGKGTQAQYVSVRFNIPIISPGDILRQEIKNGSELGRKAQSYVKSGKLVPDKIIVDMIKKKIADKVCSNGFILDGFPRNLNQAEALDDMLESMGKGIDRAIYFNILEDKIVERLSGRRVCRECGETYHLLYDPPENDTLCDKCGGKLYQRDDDKPKIIKKRLSTYRGDTAPIIDYYRKKDYYLEINADDDIESIKNRILQELGG